MTGAFSGKVETDLGSTRDRHSISPKSATADLGGFPQKMRPTRESFVRLIQLGIVCATIAALELLCRLGIINRFTMIPPSEMMLALANVVATAPWFWSDVSYTLGNLAAAIGLSVLGGFLIGLAVHAVPRLRRVLDPIFTSYYAVPTFVLYPLLIVFFGLGPTSLIVLGALFGIVAMIVATV